MISCISWVPKGASKPIPTPADPPSKEELEAMKSSIIGVREEAGDEENDESMDVDASGKDEELAHALSAANALGKTSKRGKPESDCLTDALQELNMDHYDEEDDGLDLLGSDLTNLYYGDNNLDPYLINKDDDDSEEEEDAVIKPEDAVLVCARNEDDVSHLEVWILEDPSNDELNFYVHHEILIPAFPLCTTWLDFNKGGDKGNFIAVGSMDPAIEIWDLDTKDPVQPSVTLGGITEKKRKGKKKSVKYKDGSHTDAVIGLSWNKEYRNVLASAGADNLVKIWDLEKETCTTTLENHTDKVQAVAWNPHNNCELLSGSFDHTVVMKDARWPSKSGSKWTVSADVESIAWNPHEEHLFVVSLENGTVVGFDTRVASSDPSSQLQTQFTIHAHDKAVCSVAYNTLVPNLLATGSMDKTVKLWDMSNQPSCVASKNLKAGAVFTISFSEDCPYVLAIGGSKGKLQVWDLLSDAELARRYGNFANKPRAPSS